MRGDVGTDRHWIAKDSLEILRSEIGHKAQAHRFDHDTASAGSSTSRPANRTYQP